MGITPNELAAILGLEPKVLRDYLRSVYRPNGEDAYDRWQLDYEMALDVARHVGKSLPSGLPQFGLDFGASEDPVSPSSRMYFDSIEDALRQFGLAVANQSRAREVAARVEHSALYIPQPNQPYIALVEPDGKRVVATINRGYAWVRNDAGHTVADFAVRNESWWTVHFPENAVRSGGITHRRFADAAPQLCRTGQHQLPAAGVCDYCDD
ncbi:hypothetical protein LGT39_09515 [Demequina sp. TTPB684]|uniref:hypothetical protein n=1 Tax=unclassified Demequina TaxID=2620311 RepID=UPI001CF4F042|nr:MULTISPECIES: hypothetical protein [unclassified Demequina]MCB2413078.1 hypothetical protein [Demequina sp. TTPB684]UPU88114.1 hypothetical protein LGT36_012825 [Demequina sp. TMPB413]